MRIVALDVGNTSVALARFDGSPATSPPSASEHRARGTDERAELAAWVAAVRSHAPEAVVVGANHGFGRALGDAVRAGIGARVRVIDRGDAFPLRTDLLEPATAGVDRLASALAAFTLAGGPALIVNAGTAFTVDWIDAGPCFRGGAILPGRALQSRALHERTARLPPLELWSGPPPPLPGRGTAEAIRAGIDVAIVAGVSALLAGLAQAAGAKLPRFVSGGDAAWLHSRLGASARLEPFLAARGLALAVERAP